MFKVPNGYSRSCDKIRETLMQKSSHDVKQFLQKNNPAQFIDPSTFKLSLKDEEESKEQKTETDQNISKDSGDEESNEMKQINQHAKTVNIRFGNFSMLMRASQLGISSKLLLLLGMGSAGAAKNNSRPLLDANEEALFGQKTKKEDSWD